MTHLIEERSASPSEPITRRFTQRSGPLLLIAATVFAVDQLSKAIVRSRLAIGEHWPSDFELIRFSHVENDGAAFGILQGAGPLLIVTTAVAIVVIVLTLIRAADQPRVYTIALALILGGAVGNLADRLARGAVTDFIDPTHYPSFNLADSAIVIGVSALLIYSLFERTPEDHAPEEPS